MFDKTRCENGCDENQLSIQELQIALNCTQVKIPIALASLFSEFSAAFTQQEEIETCDLHHIEIEFGDSLQQEIDRFIFCL